jgi:hypothetical protein
MESALPYRSKGRRNSEGEIMKFILRVLAVVALLLGAVLPAHAVAARCLPSQEGLIETAAPDLATLLPASREIPGWSLDGEPLAYEAENLWEYIDGSAENFLAFDFLRMVTQGYASEAQKGLKVEIYELSSPLMAYGIYAQMRSPGLAFHEIGNEAFADEYTVNFWKDRYFVRVAVFEKSDELSAALKVFASAIAAKIQRAGTLPPESCAFADEGLVPKSTGYLTKGVLGREQFPPSFVASYRVGDEQAKLYLSTLADSAAARDTLGWYISKLQSFQATAAGSSGEYIQGLGKDPYQGDVIAFQFGKWFGVLAGLKNPAERGAEIVRKTVERLKALDADRTEAPARDRAKPPEPAKK